jgi:hypothetical protein
MKRRYFNLAGFAFLSTIVIGCTKTTEPTAKARSSDGLKATPTSAASAPPSATATPAQAIQVLRSGTFVDGEHPTKGMARIIQKGGQRILELDQAFQTSTSGPDLVVILH